MAISLGQNPWILISLIFLELLFIIIPVFISSRVKDNSFREELKSVGFTLENKTSSRVTEEIAAGLLLGALFFVIGGFILVFFRAFLVETFLGSEFVKSGQEGAISTDPVEPDFLQVSVLIVLQFLIVGPCEEAFFRSFLIKNLSSKFQVSISVLISSFLFALYHTPPFLVPLTTILSFFGYYFTFGILLSLIFLLFDQSLVPCALAHSFFNVLILLI